MDPRERISIGFVACIIIWGADAGDLHAASTTEEQPLQARVTVDSSAVNTAPRSALLRSMLVPGWGQYYNKRHFKSALIFAATCALGLGTAYENRALKRSSSPTDRTWHRHQRNTYVISLIGTILYGMADAYVDAHLKDFDIEMGQVVLMSDAAYSGPILVYSVRW